MLERLKNLFGKRPRGSTWDSTLLAASEELVDDSDLSATIPLPTGITFEMVVSFILSAARNSPHQPKIINHLIERFGLQSRSALIAIDRTLGGVVRASAGRPEVCPDPVRDPLAWHSFQMASADRAIIEDIYPGLQSRDEPPPPSHPPAGAAPAPPVAELGGVRRLAPRILNLCLPELVTVQVLHQTGEAYRCADLLLRVHAIARRKDDFSLGPYPTDAEGVAHITKADLAAEVAATIDSGLMDYCPIEDCHPTVQISLWTPDDILRAHNCRSTTWTSLLSGEQRRWHSIGELLALYSRALIATRSLAGLRPLDISAEWTDPSAKHCYDMRLL